MSQAERLGQGDLRVHARVCQEGLYRSFLDKDCFRKPEKAGNRPHSESGPVPFQIKIAAISRHFFITNYTDSLSINT
jgi:hypothetical protein